MDEAMLPQNRRARNRGSSRSCIRRTEAVQSKRGTAARKQRELAMVESKQKIGWIGVGRMGHPMAERLLAAGHDVAIFNRTRAKAEPLAKRGGRVVDRAAELAAVDVLFSIVSTGPDLEQVYFGDGGVAASRGRLPKIFVDCSTIGVEESATIRRRLADLGADFVAAPVSGNAKCVQAGKLSAVVSGPERACRIVRPLIEAFAPRGVFYVG